MTDKNEANSCCVTPRLQEPSSKKVNITGLVKKLVDNVKTNNGHIDTWYQGNSNKKLNTTEFIRAMTFGTTKDKTLNIKGCTDIKSRPSTKSTLPRTCMEVDGRADTRV